MINTNDIRNNKYHQLTVRTGAAQETESGRDSSSVYSEVFMETARVRLHFREKKTYQHF